MKEKGIFNITKLLAIIIVLLIVILVAATITLPSASKAREKAFRLEATNAVEGAENAIKKYKDNELTINNDTNSCRDTIKYCFTVKELSRLDLYKGDSSKFKGKIEIYYDDESNHEYNVFFRKNDEFRIIGGFRKSYTEFGVLSIQMWNEDYEACNCENN